MEYPCGGGGVSSQPSAVFPSIHRKPRTSDASATEARDAAVRAVKTHLREIVRDDWTYEPSPSPTQAPTPHHSSITGTLEAQEWRERELDTCSDTEGHKAGSSAIQRSTVAGEEGFPRSESPDTAERRILERRTKRRKLLEEEMGWNNGLRTYVERRDAWSGARIIRRKRPTASRKAISKITTNEQASDGTGNGRTGSGNGSRNSADDAEMVDHESCLSSSLPLSAGTADTSMSTAPDLHRDDSSFTPKPPGPQPEEENTIEEEAEPETLIPVVPPIIPLSNPVRASIDSSIYPSIYSKVVIQSLTPTIPINLADMTKCLVQGWKADGQWPPQGTATQDVVAVKKKTAVGQYTPIAGMLGSNTTGAGNKNQPNEPAAATATRQKRGSGVGDTMRKVLGFPLHSFHLRRNSQATEQPESPTK